MKIQEFTDFTYHFHCKTKGKSHFAIFDDFEENLGISKKNCNPMFDNHLSDFTGIHDFPIKLREKHVETIKIAKCDFPLVLQ